MLLLGQSVIWRQVGQLNAPPPCCRSQASKQDWQKVWRHFSIFGSLVSLNCSRHTEHSNSLLTSSKKLLLWAIKRRYQTRQNTWSVTREQAPHGKKNRVALKTGKLAYYFFFLIFFPHCYTGRNFWTFETKNWKFKWLDMALISKNTFHFCWFLEIEGLPVSFSQKYRDHANIAIQPKDLPFSKWK